jgi:hypothetical protein
MNFAHTTLLTFALAISAHADTACIGITGPKCDRTYPLTPRGVLCEDEDTRQLWKGVPPKVQSTTVYFAPITFTLTGFDFCTDAEAVAYLKDGDHWLPWVHRPSGLRSQHSIWLGSGL